MTRNSVCIVVLLLVFCLVPTSDAQNYWAVCFPNAGHVDWQLLVTRPNGFCFHYPPRYRAVFADERLIALAQRLSPQARLTFWLDDKPFKLEELRKMTAAGDEPEPTEIGGLTFYFSGRGARQSGYSDYYFFNLRGKLLHVEFDDPYIDDLSSHESKESEKEILQTFLAF
jgi:hypothetical protein